MVVSAIDAVVTVISSIGADVAAVGTAVGSAVGAGATAVGLGAIAPEVAGIVGTGIAASWNRKDHVVAFLSTNQLLTKEGSYYDVCDAQGNIAFTFPAGSLRFAGEYWDSDGTPRSAFTTVLPVEGGSSSSSSSMNVTIYSIPTKSLNTLK